MDFERAVILLAKTDATEVPVMASVYGQPEPGRFLMRKTFTENRISTLHLQTFPSTLPCPLSPYVTSQERHHFNQPATAPATSPINSNHRTVRVFHRPRGRLLYFCHETHIDPAVRRYLKNNCRCLAELKRVGINICEL